jgi:hypothetical protein
MRIDRVVSRIGTISLIVIGVVHVVSTPFFFGPPSADAAWFAGSGLTLIFVGLLNLIVTRDPRSDRMVRWARHIANGLTVWLAGFVVSQLSDPVSFVVLMAAILQGAGGASEEFARLRRTA